MDYSDADIETALPDLVAPHDFDGRIGNRKGKDEVLARKKLLSYKNGHA